MIAAVWGSSVVGVAVVVAAALVIMSVACVLMAMIYARRDARIRRAAPSRVPLHPPGAPAPLQPLHEVNLRMRQASDPIVRMQLAAQMAHLGGGQAALLLVAAVRDGVITPTAGAYAVSQTGFDGGVIAGVALRDPDPRVQVFARMVLDGAMLR